METSLNNPSVNASGKLPRSVVIAGAVMFVIIVVFIGGPRASLASLAVLAGLAMYRLIETGGLRPAVSFTPLLAMLGLFGGYLLINASWSQLPLLAYGKVAIYFAIVATVTLGSAALKSADQLFLQRLSFNLLLAALILGVYLAIEVIFESPLRRAAATLFPFLTPPLKHASVVDGVVAQINAYRVNRSIATACLVLWPTLLVILSLYSKGRAWLLAASLVTVTLLATLYSEHETSMLALGFSALVFIMAVRLPRVSIWAVGAGWSAATLLVIPIAFAAYAQNLHFSNSIPFTGKARIILWEYTAEQSMKQPFFGVGLQSTQTIDEARKTPPEQPKGFIYPLKTSRHAHNIYMQTWYELGAVGAILLWLSGLAVLRVINAMNQRGRPFVLATFVGAAVTGAFSWGMWQPWFMGAFGMSALLAVMSYELSQRETGAPD